MAVIIEDMEMPNKCENCEFYRWSDLCQTGWCNRIDQAVPNYKEMVDSSCPMKPYEA